MDSASGQRPPSRPQPACNQPQTLEKKQARQRSTRGRGPQRPHLSLVERLRSLTSSLIFVRASLQHGHSIYATGR